MTTDTITKKRILFVDDEPSILAALKNLLYKDRKRWDMAFALSGEAALEMLAVQPVDVLVSDMRMPGMDGATFLNRVKAEWPATARIMLSGHADREAIVRALPAVHQLLAKPCDAATLRGTIERCLEVESSMPDPRVRAVIGKMDRIPSSPHTVHTLATLISSSTVSLAEVVALISQDPGMSAKVLQLVNSDYFGGKKTSSLVEALSLLGTEQLRYICMTATVFSAATIADFPGFSLESARCDAVREAKLTKSEPGYAGALLQDVGKLVLAFGFPAEYEALHAEAEATGVSKRVLERRVFGATHPEIGACLLGLWGLPADILDLVRGRWQHDVLAVRTGLCPTNVSMLS
ncbi:response regulator [soil metagenome]